MQPPVLVLTATIQPRAAQPLVVRDPAVRRDQYLQALNRWLSNPHDHTPLVLVENSGAALDEFRVLAAEFPRRQVECISTSPAAPPAGAGKGYGEFEMIDAALDRSELLRDAEHFAKITGRLTIANWRRMIERLPDRYDLIADAHLVPRDRDGGRIDSRLVFFSSRFYREQLSGWFRTMDDAAGFYAEHALFRAMQTAPGEADLFTRLPIEPKWRGESASTGVRYNDAVARWRWPLKAARRMRDRLMESPSVQQIRQARRSVD